MADITELYETREKEHETLRAMQKARAEGDQKTRALTEHEKLTVMGWQRATRQHAFAEAAKNTPKVKRKVLEAFNTFMAANAPKAASKPATAKSFIITPDRLPPTPRPAKPRITNPAAHIPPPPKPARQWSFSLFMKKVIG